MKSSNKLKLKESRMQICAYVGRGSGLLDKQAASHRQGQMRAQRGKCYLFDVGFNSLRTNGAPLVDLVNRTEPSWAEPSWALELALDGPQFECWLKTAQTGRWPKGRPGQMPDSITTLRLNPHRERFKYSECETTHVLRALIKGRDWEESCKARED